MKAVVNFRVMRNGGFIWTKGLTRGFWRVLVVTDPMGCTRANCHNVLDILYTGPIGFLGVTPRSGYCLDASEQTARQIAAEYNARQARVDEVITEVLAG